jgi:hypothetical protein
MEGDAEMHRLFLLCARQGAWRESAIESAALDGSRQLWSVLCCVRNSDRQEKALLRAEPFLVNLFEGPAIRRLCSSVAY